MEGFKREIQTCPCIVHRASSIEHRASFAGSICHTPPPWKAPCGFYAQFQVRMLCKKEVRKSEFCGIRPLTTNNLLRVHHCLLPLLLGWLTGEGRFYLRIRYSGTRYQVPGSLRFRAVPGTWYASCGDCAETNGLATPYLCPILNCFFKLKKRTATCCQQDPWIIHT